MPREDRNLGDRKKCSGNRLAMKRKQGLHRAQTQVITCNFTELKPDCRYQWIKVLLIYSYMLKIYDLINLIQQIFIQHILVIDAMMNMKRN